MSEPLHIASLLLHCRPQLLPGLLNNLRQLPDVELHQHSAEGKLVLVLEAGHEQQILARIDHLQQLPGVLNVALIYHEQLTPEGVCA